MKNDMISYEDFLMTSSFIYITILCLYSYSASQLSTPSPPPSFSLVAPSGLLHYLKISLFCLMCMAVLPVYICVLHAPVSVEARSIGVRSFLELGQQMIIQLPCECQELNPGPSEEQSVSRLHFSSSYLTLCCCAS